MAATTSTQPSFRTTRSPRDPGRQLGPDRLDLANASSSDLAICAAITAGGMELAGTEPVLMEVLAGARSEAQRNELRRLLTSFGWLAVESATDFEGAERVYRRCRSSGITPRGLVDCMIANVAIRNDAELLAADGDFARMATAVPLRLHPSTPR